MKKKSKSLIYLAIALILVVIVASLVANTLARYANQFSATTTVTAAKWSFSAGVLSTVVKIEDTVNTADGYNLKKGTIAPGSKGSFEIALDGSGSETGVKYTVTLTKEGIPAGFSISATGSNITTSEDGNTITGYIPYSSVKEEMQKTLTINWEWELGDDETAVNGIDNQYQSNTLNIGVTVRGEQHIGTI